MALIRRDIGEPTPLSWRRHILRTGQAAIYWSGLAYVNSRNRERHGGAILMYHSVTETARRQFIAPRNQISAERFERQIRFLARERNVISVKELCRLMKEGDEIPHRTVLLTFDDGYRDNLEIVAPILARYRLPAVIYLCTGYVSRGENQWADVLYTAIKTRTRHSLSLSSKEPFDLSSSNERERAYNILTGIFIKSGRSARDVALREIERQLEPSRSAPRLTLNWDEVVELSERYPNIELGVHTSDHLDLTALTIDEACEEITRSIEEFEHVLGWRPIHFSFPYSRSSPELIARLPGLGIDSAMTGIGRLESHNDLLDLPRREVHNSETLLRLWTGDSFAGLPAWMQSRQ